MSMGYVEVEATPACPLFPAGTRARGHVFHFSEVVQASFIWWWWWWGGGGLFVPRALD
jgi:cobyrinic acid a,c-diamide synthase